MFSTSEDMRYRRTVGAQPGWKTRFLHWYVDQVLHLGTKSKWIRKRTLDVFFMLRPPAALFHPWLLARVAWQALMGRKQPAVPAATAAVASDEADTPLPVPTARDGTRTVGTWESWT
jgi:hypothetical protein